MATRGFEGIRFFQEISKEDHGMNISVKFHQNPVRSFREEDA